MITVLGQRGSNGRDVLARELGVNAVNFESTLRCNQDRFVVNWGVSKFPNNFAQRALTFSNSQEAVKHCVNKIQTLDLLDKQGVDHVAYLIGVNNPHIVRGWIRDDGMVLARTQVEGADGEGLKIIKVGEDIIPAKLYTKFFKADAEYRVHVFYGKSILIQQKRRRPDEERNVEEEGPDAANIRVSSNGWGFSLRDLDCDIYGYRNQLRDVGIAAVAAVGANHGAVDILVGKRYDLGYFNGYNIRACEVNSAPALETPATIQAWANAFREKFRVEGIA